MPRLHGRIVLRPLPWSSGPLPNIEACPEVNNPKAVIAEIKRSCNSKVRSVVFGNEVNRIIALSDQDHIQAAPGIYLGNVATIGPFYTMVLDAGQDPWFVILAVVLPHDAATLAGRCQLALARASSRLAQLLAVVWP